MADIILFKPRRELGAEANLYAFISLCKERLTVFGADLNFSASVWDLSDFIKRKARNMAVRAVFSSWETRCNVKPEPMEEPFQSFAKAYVRYHHALRPTKSFDLRIAALRALGAALQERGCALAYQADAGVFNRAAQLISSSFSAGSAYRVGAQLSMVAKFMDDNGLCSVPLQWANSLPRPLEGAGRVGVEFDAQRKAKLPSVDVLDALARAYRAATEPVDVVLTSVAAVLCSAPDRINEVLNLRAECEVREERRGQPPAYGLRYWPSKGAEPMVKWVVPSMRDVVVEALQRIREYTKVARDIARWYEANPKSLFLPAHLEHLRGRTGLSLKEARELVFVEPTRGFWVWCETNKIPTRKVRGKLTVSFEDIERQVLAMLPRGFPVMDPETGLKFSEALCVVRRNFFHSGRGVYLGLVEAVSQDVVSTGLGNRSQHGRTSVFERLGLMPMDDIPLAVRSHQFRHYLNTLAQAGGMSELDIAKWSGRADLRHNSAYNHVSDRDTQARISQLSGDSDESFTLAVAQARVSLFPRAKFIEMGIQAAHTTDLGFCAHDFAMSPCQLHMDCNSCNEQVCVKGDRFGEKNARVQLAETEMLLLEAKDAEVDRAYGASRWVEHQLVTAQRLRQLVAILDDPKVPVGAVIRLRHIKPASRLRQAVEARAALPGAAATPLLAWQVDEGGAMA